MENKIVSIIIVNWNGGEVLRNCIDSIFKYSKKEMFEIIVIDNNSSDNSIDLIKDYEVSIYKQDENFGFAKANNIGYKYAKGKYILALNSDTLFTDDNISIMVEEFEKQADDVVMMTAKLLNKDMSIQKNCYDIPTLRSMFFDLIFKIRKKPKGNYKIGGYVQGAIGAYMLIKKSYIDNFGMFDESYFFYHEDIDLCNQIKKNKKKIYLSVKSKVIHLGGYSTKSVKSEMIFEMHKSHYIFAEKNLSKFKLKLFKAYMKIGLLTDFVVSFARVIVRNMKYSEFKYRIKSYKKIRKLGKSK